MNTRYDTLSNRTVLARRVAAACGAGALLLGAAACGSSSPTNAADDAGANSYGGGSGATTQQGQRPGANGKVAAVSGSTAQVQSQDSGQVAVSWTASTAFTQQVGAKLADVKVGDCVMVTSEQASTGSGSDSSGTDQATPPTQPTAITAGSVRITEKVNGSCSVGRGAVAGGQAGGGPRGGTPPTGAPGGGAPGGGAPGGGAPGGGQLRGFGGAFGTVKSVSATGFVVSATMPTAPPTDGGSQTPTTTDVTVTVAAATTYTTTAKAAASAVKVGVCVSAEGKTDGTGAVTATRIAVSPAVDGACSTGFARFSRNGTDGTKAS